ncbi:histidine kinase [Marivirga sp. S37H4]|uniref:histidine kinase n=1 Tax=Marivirga aurantiaca TaxID=2802615 RepID=A0A935C772_9BACT|nr:ATP-binding protein [Marivirga aurantiaca]MBK6264760.1 histidine kinase [Marivirga aurantiaca]
MAESGVDYVFMVSAGTVILLLLVTFIIAFLFIHQRKYFEHQRKLTFLNAKYQEETMKAQMEMQEKTLEYVGRELHDNIGQILSLIKLNLSNPEADQIRESKNLVTNAIKDLRSLSHKMNLNWAAEVSLENFIEAEVQKIRNIGHFEVLFEKQGEFVVSNNENKVILFRIIQECINNTLKHSEAKQIKFVIERDQHLLIADDGKGFDQGQAKNGLGLVNIQERAKIIGVDLTIKSSMGNGTQIDILLPQNDS